jgi:hypothetical protein
LEVATKVTPRANNALQEVAEQHRIGDVPDVKLIEAQDPHLFGHALGHDIQGAL